MAQELFTEDKLEYTFHPVTAGSLQFKVKAHNDAHVALTSGPSEGDPMYEIFIGGWGNTKSVIRRNRTKPDKAEADTPDIMNESEFRGFWIRWSGGVVAVGKEGEAAPFLSWEDPEPFGIGYYGICTGWGASGSWVIEGTTEISTADNLEYIYKAVPSGALEVDVRSPSNAHISLTSASHETEPMYEVLLGGWENTASVIRYNREKPDKVRQETPGLLSADQYNSFVIKWQNGHISVKKNGAVLIEWQDPSPIGVSHFGVRTAWGAQGHWRLRVVDPRTAPSAPTLAARPSGWNVPTAPGFNLIDAEVAWAGQANAPGWNIPDAAPTGGAATWVDARAGEVPPNAVPGGFDNEQLYIGRAGHEGALIPGKVVPSHGVCYIPWGGAEHGKEEYQVLCGCEAAWLPAVGGDIPEGALPSGESEDGEPLFVGRAKHEGTVTVGKVQASHNVCYIPYGGQELGFPEYEVLVAK